METSAKVIYRHLISSCMNRRILSTVIYLKVVALIGVMFATSLHVDE